LPALFLRLCLLANKQNEQAKSDMKILLQSVLNRLYYRRPGVWTADPETALDFERSEAVFDFVDKQNLLDVQLVVKVESPLRLEVVPVEFLNGTAGLSSA
jgi:hypothetical protein